MELEQSGNELVGEFKHTGFVFAQRQPAKEHAVALPFQLPHAPMGVLAFAYVEADFQRVVELEDFLVMAPTQFARQCRAIWEYRIDKR